MPFHGSRDLSGTDLSEMDLHHFGDTSIPGTEVKESLCPPLWLDLEQSLELFSRKHKHGAPTQKPKTKGASEEDKLLVKQSRCVCTTVLTH